MHKVHLVRKVSVEKKVNEEKLVSVWKVPPDHKVIKDHQDMRLSVHQADKAIRVTLAGQVTILRKDKK